MTFGEGKQVQKHLAAFTFLLAFTQVRTAVATFAITPKIIDEYWTK